jgi:hypothetical protein
MYLLGYGYGVQGRNDEGETLSLKALEISRRVNGEDHVQTNDLRYNLACFAARRGSRDETISFLLDPLDNGFRGPSCCPSILDDPDLDPFHGDPKFVVIVEELKRRNEEEATAEEADGSE